MTGELRCVFDTNVVVSALSFPSSVPRRAFDLAHDRGVILASEETLGELVEVLRRAKFIPYIHVPEREAFLRAFAATVELVAITERITECRDPKDNKFLELAVCGGAQYVISGDDDMLVLRKVRETAIVTPADFIAAAKVEDQKE